MPKDMGRHSFRLQREAALPCDGDMLGYDVLDSIAAKGAATSAGKEAGCHIAILSFADPSPENGNCFLAQRRTPLLSSFALATNVRARAEDKILEAERGQLRASQSGLDGQEQQGVVATPSPSTSIRCG